MSREEKAAVATRALQALYEHRDASALATLFAPTLIQHDPAIADGFDGLVAFVREIARLERSGITIHRTLVDGDHVVVHSTLEGFPGTVGPQVAFDIFRLRDRTDRRALGRPGRRGAAEPLGPHAG